MPRNTELEFAGDLRIVVPDSLDLITTYVLREQQDWFEDEIRFVRRALRPGQQVIDIGANYGVFTLSMARSVGASGRVWAFEPTTKTAEYLAQSVALNGFDHVTVDRRALSDRPGTARISLHDNAELNELVRGPDNEGLSEEVTLTSLDDAMREQGWRNVDLVKIDAEGEESAIIRGGASFWRDESPLVQYEVKAGRTLHLELAREFADIGYQPYRLVPGLDLLVPFDPLGEADAYLLNLYGCKTDRAADLAAQARLLRADDVDAADGRFERQVDALAADARYAWSQRLATLPYGKGLAATWARTSAQGDRAELETALALHAVASDPEVDAALRFHALRKSFLALMQLCRTAPSFSRLLSLARVAREFGARAVAVNALNAVAAGGAQNKPFHVTEPFLAAGSRFDSVDPGDAIGKWLLGSVLEELERSASFSSFFTGPQSMQRLELIAQLGFGSAEMQRRRQLVNKRFAAPR